MPWPMQIEVGDDEYLDLCNYVLSLGYFITKLPKQDPNVS
jgi:hypothetical protein